MMELIQKIGFLPLLDSGIEGFSAEDIVAEDCGYVRLPEGGWDWPLWKWKGEIVQEMPCMYGKFFNKKAGFISQEWWPDFCNYRRSKYPRPDEESIEGAILSTLQSTGSLITRELRAACGFTGKGMRSKFDGYLTRLEMATYIVTEDFIYPRDKHNHEYGWGWSLLNTPEDHHEKFLSDTVSSLIIGNLLLKLHDLVTSGLFDFFRNLIRHRCCRCIFFR